MGTESLRPKRRNKNQRGTYASHATHHVSYSSMDDCEARIDLTVLTVFARKGRKAGKEVQATMADWHKEDKITKIKLHLPRLEEMLG